MLPTELRYELQRLDAQPGDLLAIWLTEELSTVEKMPLREMLSNLWEAGFHVLMLTEDESITRFSDATLRGLGLQRIRGYA